MIKKEWMGIVVLAVLCLLGSCVSEPVVFDDTLAEDQIASVFIYPGINIKSYNGIAVQKWYNVKIPAGSTAFLLDLQWNNGNTLWTAEDVEFNYRFEGGKEYVITFNNSGGNGKLWGVNIYAGPVPAIGYPGKSKLLDFVPFVQR
jgi:hypothetical protein